MQQEHREDSKLIQVGQNKKKKKVKFERSLNFTILISNGS